MIKSFSILCLLGCLLAAKDGIAADSLPNPCMQQAEKLLDEVLGFMQKTYYRKSQVSWPDLTTRAREHLRNAENCEDAYASISWCFKELDEHHSFLMPPDKAARYMGNDDPDAQPQLSLLVGEIRGEWLQDSIGYLTIPWVSTDDSLICERIADSIQAVIARLDSRGISRWIIDLRKNSGGNCWPMLTGLGPLLGEDVYGYFVSSGERIPISYRGGSAFQGRHVRCRVSHSGYHTLRDHHSIVVLTGRRTVSAGEIVALAFRGREQTCLMGEPTAGFTTANATYSLSDRSMLVLSVCQEADRTGRVCEGSVQPDKLIAVNTPAIGEDPARSAAVNWLTTR